MTQSPMTLAERIAKISGFGVLAASSDRLVTAAPTDAQAGLHWQAYEGAVKHLLILIVTPEGQAALEKIEQLAVLLDEVEAVTKTLQERHPEVGFPVWADDEHAPQNQPLRGDQ